MHFLKKGGGWGEGPAEAYPSELICNAFLIAVAVHPRKHGPLLSTLGVVENEAGGEQHVIGELIALHLKTLICELQTQPTKASTCTHAISQAQQHYGHAGVFPACRCVPSIQVYIQHAGVFSASITVLLQSAAQFKLVAFGRVACV